MATPQVQQPLPVATPQPQQAMVVGMPMQQVVNTPQQLQYKKILRGLAVSINGTQNCKIICK